MEATKVILVVHGEDVDGILSGIALLDYFGVQTEIHLATHSNYQTCLSVLSESADLSDTMIVVADLALKNSFFGTEAEPGIVEKIITGCKSLVWIDHHKSMMVERLVDLGGIFVDGSSNRRCACYLCQDWLELFAVNYEAVRYRSHLSKLAQANDYPESSMDTAILTMGDRLQRVITYYNFYGRAEALKALLIKLTIDKGWYHIISDEYWQCNKAFLEAESLVDQQQLLVEINNYKFLIALIHPLLPQKEVLRKLRTRYKNEVSACIGIFPQPVLNALVFGGQMLPSFNVQNLCTSLGGGGREGDGGFSLTKDLDWSDWSKASQAMIRLLTSYLDS